MRSGYVAAVAWDRRGEAERAAYNLARLRPQFVDGHGAPGRGPVVRAGAPARGLHRAAAEGRRDPGPPPAAPPPRRAPRGHARPRVPGVHRAAPGRRGRPHRPRHRPLHRLRHQDGRERDARLPRGRVPRRRPRVRPHRPARPAVALRRRGRRLAAALEARLEDVGQHEGARQARRRRDGGRPDQPLRRAQAPRGPRLRAGLRVAARVRARVPLPRDRRPARGDRADEGRHGVGAADGPPDLRRRRLRQDRGRAARRVQGRGRRQADAGARPDDDPRAAALRHVLGAPARLPVPDRAAVALPLRRPSSAT